MSLRTVVALAASCASLMACHGQTAGSPVAASVASSSVPASSSVTPAPLAGVGPPTASAPNPEVTGTTFDGCAVVTDAEATSWGVDPARKHDVADGTTAGYYLTRGCYWQGSKWDLRVYSTNGTLANFGQPDEDHVGKEQVQFGTRQGWIARKPPPYADCLAYVPSQSGIAIVQMVGKYDIQKSHTDLCPNAIEIMKTIEPRIP